jgi:DNA-directed RNA polymerase subunit M/transcription elongation factor TFIIS
MAKADEFARSPLLEHELHTLTELRATARRCVEAMEKERFRCPECGLANATWDLVGSASGEYYIIGVCRSIRCPHRWLIQEIPRE